MNDNDRADGMTDQLFDRRPASPRDDKRMQHMADEALARAASRRETLEKWLFPRNWPFRLKANLGITLLGLVPLFLAVLLIAHHADSVIRDDRATALQNQTAAAAAMVGDIIGADVSSMQTLAASRNIVQVAGAATKGQAGAAPLSLASIQQETVYIAGPAGNVVAASQPALVGHAAGGVPAAKQAMDGREAVAVLGRPLAGVKPALSVAVPIMHGKSLLGAVVGEFDPTPLFLALYRGSNALSDSLLAADGRAIAGGTLPEGGPITLVGGNPVISVKAESAFAALKSANPIQLANGSWVARAIPGGPGTSGDVVLVAPDYSSPEGALDSLWLKAAIAVLAMLAIAAAVWFTRQLARPLESVARALAMVRAGNFGIRTGINQHDEIGEIAATVDMLISRTQTLVRDLDNQRADLENGVIQLFTELSEAASGDLTVRPTMSEGSLGAVADSVSILLDRFKNTVKRIQATTYTVSMHTSKIALTINQVSQEARRQSEQLTASAEAIAEMAESAETVSQRTRSATDVASQAVDAVNSGNSAVTVARDAVRRTSETSRKAVREVKSLGESAQLMGNALLLVQHNTEELHIIAGNASIEAARFADSGGVFRTVADSIEQLAQQSQEALRQIQTVIENTQRETSRVVAAIEDVTQEVGSVAKAVNLAGENFDTIYRVVQRLADLNVFIAGASKQQAAMAANVADMMSTLNQISVQTSTHTAASAEDAVHLRELTDELSDSVATLKVS
jgi:methyl-accepting chemotaxis protein